MSIERDLVSQVLAERDISVLADAGITSKFFLSHDHREAFQFILDHHREYSEVPSLDAFKRNYPTYRITEPTDTLRYFCDELAGEYSAFLLEDGLVKATDQFEEGDVDGAKMTIAQCLTQLNQEITKVQAVDITKTGPERLLRYETYANNRGVLKGISTGFDALDLATSGMQPGQLFTFVGPPKAGKSTMMLLSALFAHMGYHKPLFIGFEMSNQEQEERHDAIRAGISHERLRNGHLSADDKKALSRMMRRVEGMPAMILTADTHGTSTLSGISALIEKYEPDVVYVDGMYLMDDEEGEAKGSPQALTNLTRGFKRMAQNRKIPIAISTQVLAWKMDRKKGVTTSSIGYASSFAQDSDVLIGVEPTDDPNVNKVKILDGRNVQKMEIFVRWDWEQGTFEEIEGIEEEAEDDETAATRF